MMNDRVRASALFDDIFKLQNTVPDAEADPEDPDDGFKASLVDRIDDVETPGHSLLRKQAAIIPDDPKYRGKKTSRQDLYQEDEDYPAESSQNEESDSAGSGDMDTDEDESKKHSNDEEDYDDDDDNVDSDISMEHEADIIDNVKSEDKRADPVVLPSTEADDREKGKALTYQLGVWDDLIKARIAFQKLVTSCNRLPLPSTWSQFSQHQTFRQEANNVHSSVKKLVSSLLDLQMELSSVTGRSALVNTKSADMDEEITSSSEEESEEKEEKESRQRVGHQQTLNADEDNDSLDEGNDDEEEEDDGGGDDDDKQTDPKTSRRTERRRGGQKHKLAVEEVEETLAKRHREFQTFRNATLSKWDEKTRLAHGKIKAKNFAAFEMSILKQIEQILVNRERLVKRLHQQRASYRILGQVSDENDRQADQEQVIDDDEEDVEHKLERKSKQEVPVLEEIIDDNDFYHICLRDLIQLKQNEETDPISSNKQWLEIQRLRNKQKGKVDTRASKGRKIRYNVKEKLKNYMTPYDKSRWSEEQKDDLFKALFGGSQTQQSTQESTETSGINIGL